MFSHLLVLLSCIFWICQSCSHLRPCPGCAFHLKDPGRISTGRMPSLPHISNGMSSSWWERSLLLAAVCYYRRFWFSLHWFPFSSFCSTNHLLINYAVYWFTLYIVHCLPLPVTIWILWGQESLLIGFTHVFQPPQTVGDTKHILESYLLEWTNGLNAEGRSKITRHILLCENVGWLLQCEAGNRAF